MTRSKRIALPALLATAGLAIMPAFSGVAQAHDATCTESVNPHGQNIPPAGSTTLPGPRGGQNEDGFYLLSRTGDESGIEVSVRDTGSGTVFGPFPAGTVIKYTQAPGGTPDIKKIGSENGQAGAVSYHIKGTGDLVAFTDTGKEAPCNVPPPPK